MVNQADIVIEIKDGRVVAVHSTHPIKYAVLEDVNELMGMPPDLNSFEIKENETLGTYRQILQSLGVQFVVTREYNEKYATELIERTFLKHIYSRARNTKNPLSVKTIFNTFISVDDRLMEEYVKIQTP